MVAICVNPFRDSDLIFTRQVFSYLSSHGYECRIFPIFVNKDDYKIPDELPYCRIEGIDDGCSIAVVIGGDGTILNVARNTIKFNIPIFGINLGTKGFLCSVEPEDNDCFSLLLDAVEGSLFHCKRMMINVELYRNNQLFYTDFAINDVVLHGLVDCIQTDIFIEDKLIHSYFGDGVVVSTPTGSTGYSMSAGGPIVEPTSDNFIITPICAHSLSARSFVLGVDNSIFLTPERLHGRKAYLSVDGCNPIPIEINDKLKINKSDSCFTLLERDPSVFYLNILNKLS